MSCCIEFFALGKISLFATLELEKVGGKEIFKPVKRSLWNLDFSLSPLSLAFRAFFFSPSKFVYSEKTLCDLYGGSNDYTINSNYYHYHCKTDFFFFGLWGRGILLRSSLLETRSISTGRSPCNCHITSDPDLIHLWW